MNLSGSSGHSSLHGFIRQFWAFLFTWIYQAVLGSPLYMDLSGSSEDQAIPRIRQFWAFMQFYADLSSSSEKKGVLGIPLYMDSLGSSEYQAVLSIYSTLHGFIEQFWRSGSSEHSSLHGFIRQFWAFLFTWIYQAVLGIPVYMALSGSSEHSSLHGFIRQFWGSGSCDHSYLHGFIRQFWAFLLRWIDEVFSSG